MRVVVGRHLDACRFRCWVDGVEVSLDCVGADDVEGWADVYVRSADDRLVVGPDNTLVVDRMRGEVRLVGPGYTTPDVPAAEPPVDDGVE